MYKDKKKTSHHYLLPIVFCTFFICLEYPLLLTNLANIHLLQNIEEDKLVKNPGASLYIQGVVAYHQKQFKESIILLKKAKYKNQNLTRWYIAQAYAAQDKWHLALTSLNLEIGAQRRLYGSILFAHILGLSYEEQRIWQQQICSYPDIILSGADYLLNIQQYQEAEKWAKSLLNYEQSVEAQLIVGQSYFWRPGGIADSEKIFGDIYERTGDTDVAFWYGRALLYNGKPLQAIPLLEEAVMKQQNRIVSWYLYELGLAYIRVGRCDDAQAVIKKSLQEDSSPDNVQRMAQFREQWIIECSNK